MNTSFFDERFSRSHFSAPQKRILHDGHNRLVRLRRYDHFRYHHQLGNFRSRFVRLRQVHVHFIAIEIGVVRRRHGDVHTKRRVRHDAHSVSHDTHFVQRRLTVKQNHVVVLHVSFNAIPKLQLLLRRFLQKSQIQTLAVFANDVLGARFPRRWVRSILHQSRQLVDVVRRNCFRVRHIQSNRPRNAELIQHQVWIGRDDRSRGKINALPHQVPSNSPGFPF
mmetsp:Transcript_1042/g.3835  ORF Transcript_1042/g.3835 Transcript_1042/m.3835 type:complete len:222 (+) Transcript_1042:3-668(+)